MAATADQPLPPRTLPAGCDTRGVLGHVTNKWGTLALLALSDGPLRWSELRRALDGVSEKMLAQCLQTLTDDDFVIRTQRQAMPPHVEYALTDAGRDITALLIPLVERVARHTGELGELFPRPPLSSER